MSLPSFPSLLERLGLDKEVGVGLDNDGGFWTEDDDAEAEVDVAEDDTFLSDWSGPVCWNGTFHIDAPSSRHQ